MFRAGINLLSVWCLLNILPGIGSLVYIFLGKNAPAFQMLFEPNEIKSLDPRAVATTNGLAIIANTMIISYFSLFLFVVRRCLIKKEKWAFYALVSGIGILQVSGYWADKFFLDKNFLILNISSLILVFGFGVIGYEIFANSRGAR